MRRMGRRDQQEPVQGEGLLNFYHGSEMAHMDRVEGTAKNA
jgi:hypothetical protein